MNITIFTATLGREKYVKKLIESVINSTNWTEHSFFHYIVYQGEPTKEFQDYVQNVPYKLQVNINKDKKKSIGKLLEEFKPICNSDILWKLDDDALLYGENAFDHIEQLYKLYDLAIFSPYPVGFIEHLGGAKSRSHVTVYSKQMDTYYTLRISGHIPGFARIMPVKLFKQIDFTDRHNEDVECSNWCLSNEVPMFTLENTLIVEHQETILGQYHRYGEDYMKKKLS